MMVCAEYSAETSLYLFTVFFWTGVAIGLERSVYIVTERPGAIHQVCAVVRNPRSGCSVRMPLSLEVSTRDVTAGIVYHCSLCMASMYIHSIHL